MKIELSRTPVGILYVVTLAGLSLTSIGLALALWRKASLVPPVLLVPGNDRPRLVEAGRVPDALARDFAQDYIVQFENYSPATIEAGSTFTKTRVAPQVVNQFAQLLENRRKLVLESGMVSQLLLETPGALEVTRGEDRLEVLIRALRRVYVADKLAQEAKLIYRVALEPGEPTRGNPTGLFVLGVSARLQPKESGGTHGPGKE
jgi:hypothetical protein